MAFHIDNLVTVLNRRLRPSEGWSAFLLLVTAVVLLMIAVNEVKWVPEIGVVRPTALIGLLLAAILAKRPLAAIWAWLLLFIYATLITVISLGRLLPPFAIFRRGWPTIRQYWLQNGTDFLNRMKGWLVDINVHGGSQETIVFAFILGILSFLIAAYAGWATFRQRRPLPGLLLLGLALAVNNYFGETQIWWLGMFIGVAALLTAVINIARLEEEWNQSKTDYPENTRLEITIYAAVISVGLLSLALYLPTINFSRFQAWFAETTAVSQAESAMGDAFGGVNVPRGGVGGSGLLPREYLLGGSPDLLETVMMTAEVFIEVDGEMVPAPAELLGNAHWRSLSYDVYTGEGWAISRERRETVDPFETIPHSYSSDNSVTLHQTVYWQYDNRLIRYTLGLPLTFDQETTVHYRRSNDMARVRGQGNIYQVTTRLPNATPAELRRSKLADVPALILEKNTALPESIPVRIYDLAQEIAGELDNPYDQARAIETFLHQYPYSLDVPSPPENRDPVDYFLFDLQTGYCDYYASSMVVLARTLGLPARLGVGYLVQAPDENGVQTIRQENGHSWAEIYFAGVGWVEFEPTTAFVSASNTNAPSDSFYNSYEGFGIDSEATPVPPPPIPERAPARPFSWQRLVIIGLIGLFFLIWWWRGRTDRALRADGVLWAYGRLQKNATYLGWSPEPSQTPAEFSSSLLSEIEPDSATIPQEIQTITRLFTLRRYAGRMSGGQEEAKRAWQKLRWPFWRLRLAQLFSRNNKNT